MDRPSTPEQRREEGRAARAGAPRRSLGVLADRPASYDALARLAWRDEGRDETLLAIKHQRMLEGPLAFLRGAALVMADDLERSASTTLDVQLCGDAHLANFGVFASPERRLVFDINDFDETERGPFEWDLKRLASSVVIASDQLGHDETFQVTLARETAREYQRSMRRFAAMTRLQVWYARFDVRRLDRELRGFFTQTVLAEAYDVIQSARSTATHVAYERLIERDANGIRIRSRAPHVVALRDLDSPTDAIAATLGEVLAHYRGSLPYDRAVLLDQFSVADVARQVMGVGSVGTECYIVLFTGRDESDPFVLQVKEARDSSVALARSSTNSMNCAERVVHGQQLMQATTDAFLGWHAVAESGVGASFYVRQLYDHKASVDLTRMDESRLLAYAKVCAWVLARAHARSGRSAQIAGYLGRNDRFARVIGDFAIAYRDRNLTDYVNLELAVREGRIAVAR
ncbi:MAG TPA: DUF2252 domain-containing protein [Acidimicrobiales bacterium]|nr:DUF2252 domain-containing protein [Acidimicrobiales bacterium]